MAFLDERGLGFLWQKISDKFGAKQIDDFVTLNSPFQIMFSKAQKVDKQVHFSMDIYIGSLFISGYTYTIGTVASSCRPVSAELGTGHSTDMNVSPKGTVTWIIETNGELKINLQSTDGAYVFISGSYMCA